MKKIAADRNYRMLKEATSWKPFKFTYHECKNSNPALLKKLAAMSWVQNKNGSILKSQDGQHKIRVMGSFGEIALTYNGEMVTVNC